MMISQYTHALIHSQAYTTPLSDVTGLDALDLFSIKNSLN